MSMILLLTPFMTMIAARKRLPPPPTPVIQHVLHFENLHTEFANLMTQYNLEYIVLPKNPHHNEEDKEQQQQQQQQSTTMNDTTTTTIISNDDPPHQPKIRSSSLVLGVANLTESTRRLIEKVYARDFAAFGYELMQ
jgi:hypothetical protein